MFDNWTNIYQDVNSAQQQNNMLLSQMYNNMGKMDSNMYNNMNMNYMQMNNPMEQIQMMSNIYNNNYQQIMQTGQFNINNNIFNNKNMNNNMNINNMNQNQDIKINLCFSTMEGARIIMIFDQNETIDSVLTKFLKRCNLDDLIGKIQGNLTFLFMGQSLNFGDFRKLKDIIMMPLGVTNILVIDTKDLIGAFNIIN